MKDFHPVPSELGVDALVELVYEWDSYTANHPLIQDLIARAREWEEFKKSTGVKWFKGVKRLTGAEDEEKA